MFGLGPFELMVVGVVAVLLFGSKLPEVARSLGSSYHQFKKGMTDIQSQIKDVEMDVRRPLDAIQDSYTDEVPDPDHVEPVVPKFTPPPRLADTDPGKPAVD